ncbi:LOW QUALITY PROTEIN: diuretic hormone receptor [Drosophila gunungcola]|uniref:LOW QUALITY PROTEIN: diuretic hormone receptor n=1 Tax=Drosophila gunungcola TaxID=103775 RepID=UPI0022E4A35A|nr:LOW QUALITY PROTEIN: diuretic hormone receptor [Drosophila gunungcola]
MADDDLRALVDSLDDASHEDLAKVIANFSLDMLQRASALIGAQQQPHSGALLHNRTQQCQEQADLEALTAGGKRILQCPSSFDSVLCWPRTNAGSLAVLPCFEEFKGVHYDTTENATRFCFANGTWDRYSDYDRCHQNSGSIPVVPDFSPNVDLPAIIYTCGYFLSFATLVVALIIFLSFKDLRCLRNTIHANLFVAYSTSALLWILTLFLQVITTESSQAGCITLVIMYQYFYLTNFFWMFVEGLYLYTLVVQTFSSDNISFITYALIGWGCPAICILVWSIAKTFAPHLENEHFNGLEIECAWMRESHIDWIFKGPASLALLVNLVFLIRIMWVLITKLRSAHTLETRQYYKASKALLVLIPLFGITYLVVLTGPEQGISRNLFEAIRAFLLSTQGFFVALFYCFLNSEVRQTLRHRFTRWRESRNIHRNSSIKNRSTEECVICLRPSPHSRLGSLQRYHSIDITDFV